ncbi:hypothetical protein BKP45_04890 [Anaerobacillus alkalidiazotrophicus]|uniref:Uncharacterized protein n=1 Tax=Anaerobacillus alkalidiazotrophicus TaxID=472963 RepID=A0A1S2MBQ0_9BACI|nr:hypothetical protein [Anaerobacillus alkalidiazotrophicus]OIJ22016.1 hypothetical protein BKP45_04890 [Anaerobacillus alkalidiazotrophicus]
MKLKLAIWCFFVILLTSCNQNFSPLKIDQDTIELQNRGNQGIRGNPHEIIEGLEQEINELRDRNEEIVAEINSLGTRNKELEEEITEKIIRNQNLQEETEELRSQNEELIQIKNKYAVLKDVEKIKSGISRETAREIMENSEHFSRGTRLTAYDVFINKDRESDFYRVVIHYDTRVYRTVSRVEIYYR